MKKGINFGVIVSIFVACCVMLCSCANAGHNQAESAQVDLSRVDVYGIYLARIHRMTVRLRRATSRFAMCYM